MTSTTPSPEAVAAFLARCESLKHMAEAVRRGEAPRLQFLLQLDGVLDFRPGEDAEARTAKLELYELREAMTLGRDEQGERDELAQAASEAYTACISAWGSGEPRHRVDAMIDAVDNLGVLIGELGAGAGRRA